MRSRGGDAQELEGECRVPTEDLFQVADVEILLRESVDRLREDSDLG